MQGHRLVQVAARRGAAVAATIGQIRAGFVHQDQTRHIFLRKSFQKQLAQAYGAGRVAFGGVDAFFAPPTQGLGGPLSRRTAQGRSPHGRQQRAQFVERSIGLGYQTGTQVRLTKRTP